MRLTAQLIFTFPMMDSHPTFLALFTCISSCGCLPLGTELHALVWLPGNPGIGSCTGGEVHMMFGLATGH